MPPLRLLAPRAGFVLHSRQLQQRWLVPSIRSASTNPPPPKPRVLEKPDRFRPPSHPSRIRSKPRYTGPSLSEHEREAQKTRRYPHMMPPEGTLMHWFLTNRWIHVWITLGILVTLVVGTFIEDFRHTTPYLDLLPPNSMFFSHPIRFFGRYIEVYLMHVSYTSEKTAERRRQGVEDVKKRAHYKKAHGLDEQGGIFGWTAKPDDQTPIPALRDGGVVPNSPGNEPLEVEGSTTGSTEQNRSDATYLDFEGNSQPVRKKWLGIW